MYENLLQEAGLTKNESLVYLALLKLGKAKSGKIVKEAGISSGKIYETLNKLGEKGLVKFVSENGVKHFSANDPEMILRYLKEREEKIHKKEKELEKVLPELTGLKKQGFPLENVSLIKGFRGISTIIYNVLETGKDIKIMGVCSTKDVKFNNFWKKWHHQRIRLKKKSEIIFSDKGSEYWKFFKKLSLTEIREITSLSPSAVMIIDENVFIFSYEEEFMCIHIASQSIANSFKSFFMSLWNVAKN